MDFTDRELTFEGVTIAVRDSGGMGKPVVVLHGLAGSGTEFLTTAEALPGFRVLLVDQRGHGRSTRIPVDLSREAYVADVVSVIEKVVGTPAALVGQSMGAHTAMLVAAARPDLVERLVLLECGFGSASPDETRAMGDYFRSWPVPFSDAEVARLFLGDGALERAWVNDLELRDDGLWPRFDADVMVETLNAVAAPRWKEWWGVTAPTLVVYADNGMFTEAEKCAFLQGGRNARRIDLVDASHDAHLDAHGAWIRALREFILPQR